MDKYKVVLADDEAEVLNSIRRNIRWEELGFEIVGALFNGKDVMELLEVQEADLLITDIRMPFMDGMELLKIVRKKYPHMKLVIISGYDDFNYAKEAMAYDVTDYILKPINAIELEEALKKVKENLDQVMEEKKNIHILERQYIANLPIIRENLLNRIISGNICEKDAIEELDNCAVGIARAECWCVALIQIERIEPREGEESMERQLWDVYIRSLVREKCRDCHTYASFYNMFGECIIFGMKKKDSTEQILFWLNEVAREGRRVMGVHLAIGVGKRKDKLLECQESFQEAKEALLYRKMRGDGNVIYMEDIDAAQDEAICLDRSAVDDLSTAIKFGKESNIRQALKRIRSQVAEGKMRRIDYQAYCIQIVNVLVMLVQQQGIEAETVFGGVPDYLNVLLRYDQPERFLNWMEESSLKIGRACEGQRDSKETNLVEVAKQYMEKEYGDPDISLEKVAGRVGLTPTYFSSLFKKETGESFVEYLTKVRMEEAIRRLKDTDEKIYVIAEKTGYPDAGYFSHVFKKRFGFSPIQCRREHRG